MAMAPLSILDRLRIRRLGAHCNSHVDQGGSHAADHRTEGAVVFSPKILMAKSPSTRDERSTIRSRSPIVSLNGVPYD